MKREEYEWDQSVETQRKNLHSYVRQHDYFVRRMADYVTKCLH